MLMRLWRTYEELEVKANNSTNMNGEEGVTGEWEQKKR